MAARRTATNLEELKSVRSRGLLALWQNGSHPEVLSGTTDSNTRQLVPESGKLKMAAREGQRSAEPQSESPRIVSRGTRGADSIQVNGFINGKPQALVVDSGSNCTLLRADVLEKPDLPVVKEGLCDVTGRCP